jgi:hypothetical protein
MLDIVHLVRTKEPDLCAVNPCCRRYNARQRFCIVLHDAKNNKKTPSASAGTKDFYHQKGV